MTAWLKTLTHTLRKKLQFYERERERRERERRVREVGVGE